VPACFYESGDYTCVKDSVAMWWDSRGSTQGCWKVTLAGKRFVADAWPEGDVFGMRSTADACSQFAGQNSWR
jgi:hypothetical protein